jgi:hypothetical protein
MDQDLGQMRDADLLIDNGRIAALGQHLAAMS